MRDVFILGAGFSKAISAAMPVLCDLNKLVNAELKRRGIHVERIFPCDIESELTHLSQGHPWASESENLRLRAQFLDLVRVVCEVLDDCSMTATSAAPCDWLLKLIRWWDRKGATVITFNYDTLVERGLVRAYGRDTGIGFGNGRAGGLEQSRDSDEDPLPPDGWRNLYPLHLTPARVADQKLWQQPDEDPTKVRFHLLKLHGSINWFYLGQSIAASETIYYVEPRHWEHFKLRNANEPDDRIQYERAQYKWLKTGQPLIIPPLAEKSAYFQHHVIRGLWGDAAAALRAADRVFCLGYSLPATDIMVRILLNSNRQKGDTPFYIVNKHNLVDHFHRLLSAYYKVCGKYVSLSNEDEPIPRFVEDIIEDDRR